jgi:hypothetical protein
MAAASSDDFRTLPQQLSSCKAAVKHARIKRSLAKTPEDWNKWDKALTKHANRLTWLESKQVKAEAATG